jgi:hypothetical protein
MGEMRNAYKILAGKPKGKKPLEELGVDGRKILQWILQKEGGKLCTGFMWLRIGTSDRLL